MGNMDIRKAAMTIDTVLRGLIAAGVRDEEKVVELATDLLRQYNPKVLEALIPKSDG